MSWQCHQLILLWFLLTHNLLLLFVKWSRLKQRKCSNNCNTRCIGIRICANYRRCCKLKCQQSNQMVCRYSYSNYPWYQLLFLLLNNYRTSYHTLGMYHKNLDRYLFRSLWKLFAKEQNSLNQNNSHFSQNHIGDRFPNSLSKRHTRGITPRTLRYKNMAIHSKVSLNMCLERNLCNPLPKASQHLKIMI